MELCDLDEPVTSPSARKGGGVPNSGASTAPHNDKVNNMNALTYSIERVIRRPAEDVFDYCSDLRSELGWNPKVKYVEKLTDGPVGVGTRYRARWANSGPTAVEVVQFDRPRTWETHAKARGMSIRFRGTVAEAPAGARYTASLALHPRRLARLVAPLALRAMRRQDQRNMQRISEALEAGPAPAWPR
jgi:uncharacterized protein YndB with AHSA1/START domain